MCQPEYRPSEESLKECRRYLRAIAEYGLDPLLRGKVEPSDLVQSTLLRGAKKLDSFRGESPEHLRRWLTEILRNEIRDQRRRFLDRKKRDLRREEFQGDLSRIFAADAENTPSREAVRNEDHQRLREAMLRLTKDHQRVLQLRNWERLTFADIATRMNRSEQAVKKLWARAVARLEREMGESDES